MNRNLTTKFQIHKIANRNWFTKSPNSEWINQVDIKHHQAQKGIDKIKYQVAAIVRNSKIVSWRGSGLSPVPLQWKIVQVRMADQAMYHQVNQSVFVGGRLWNPATTPCMYWQYKEIEVLHLFRCSTQTHTLWASARIWPTALRTCTNSAQRVSNG